MEEHRNKNMRIGGDEERVEIPPRQEGEDKAKDVEVEEDDDEDGGSSAS